MIFKKFSKTAHKLLVKIFFENSMLKTLGLYVFVDVSLGFCSLGFMCGFRKSLRRFEDREP
jgi:hypothetical protein